MKWRSGQRRENGEWGVERDGEKSRSLYKQSLKLLAATRPLLIDGDISTDTEPDFPPLLLRALQIHASDKFSSPLLLLASMPSLVLIQ